MSKSKEKNKLLFQLAGPTAFLLLEAAGSPSGLNPAAFHVLTSTAWIAIWWITEAIPIAVTAILPIVLFPLLGAVSLEETTASFGHKYIFLYIGGFIIAIAIEKWSLHKRIALNIINLIGSNLNHIILGFMVATAFLSMWISNTATSVMMLPIGMAIISQYGGKNDFRDREYVGKAIMLSIAYSASIGGIATLIGTPPNLVLAGILQELYGVKITFLQWITIGLPLSMILLIICWQYITKFAFKLKGIDFPGGKEEIKSMVKGLGKISYEEKAVLLVFTLTASAWIFRSFIQKIIPSIDDTIIAVIGGILMFLVPDKTGKRAILTWKEAVKLPWGILLLFGGGMALAKGFTVTGLADWIAAQMTALDVVSMIVLIFLLVTMVNFLTEITSNLATTAMLLPVLAPMALSFGFHPYMLMIPVTIAASCAFMLPVATPPNAVVFGSGYLRVSDMVRTGLFLNIISIIIITLFSYFFLPEIWAIDTNQFPEQFLEFMKKLQS